MLAPPGEMDRLRMNQADMERAAEETQGRFYTLADAERLPDDLPSGRRVASTLIGVVCLAGQGWSTGPGLGQASVVSSTTLRPRESVPVTE